MTAADIPAERVDDALLQAQLDLETEWRFWALVTHVDGRVFAGRAGAWRIFGTVMVRIDVPIGAAIVTHGLHPDQIADWIVCSEDEARTAAAVIGPPSPPIGSDGVVRARPSEGSDDEPF